MEIITLQAMIREVRGKKVDKLRKEEKIPAVLYGQGIKNIDLALNYRIFGPAHLNGQNISMTYPLKKEMKKK